MSKAPLTRDVVLGSLAGTLVGSTDGTFVQMYGERVSAADLRKLADQVDNMDRAVKAFYNITEVEYSITWGTANGEDGVIVLASDPVQAARKFYADHPHEIKAMYNRSSNEYVDFPNRTPRDFQ